MEYIETLDIDAVGPTNLMYQMGYLTIGAPEYLRELGPCFSQTVFHLRFPNYEARYSFYTQFMEHYAGLCADQSLDLTHQLVDDVQHGDADAFMNRLKNLFARIPYTLHGRHEHDYQTVIYVIFMMLNVYIDAEHHTSDGQIDLVLGVEKYTYVIELKVNKTARKALAQIWDRDYARGFLGQGKRVVAVGVNFNGKKAQIDNWLVAEII